MQKTCPRCGQNPCRDGQWLCKYCSAKAMMDAREKRQKRIEAARQFISAAVEYVPEPMRAVGRELVENL